MDHITEKCRLVAFILLYHSHIIHGQKVNKLQYPALCTMMNGSNFATINKYYTL